MKYLIYLLLALPALAFGTLNEVDKQLLAAKNLLRNGGFENGKAGISKTGSGTMSLSTTSANVISGKVSLDWDPSAADEYLNIGTSTYYRWDRQAGKNGVAVCSLKGAYSEYTMQIYDGTNVIAEQVLSSASTSAQTQKYYLNFVFPTTETDTSVSATLRLKSTANAVSVKVDDCWLGDASEMNISGMTTVVTDWTSYTPTFTGFGTVSLVSAHYKIVGDTLKVKGFFKAGTAAAASPTISLPSGYTINSAKTSGSKTSVFGTWTIADTNTSQLPNSARGPYPVTWKSGQTDAVLLVQRVDYNNDGTDLMYQEQNYSSMTNFASNGGHVVEFEVPINGTNTQSAYRPDAMANSWSGYHDNTCSWARTNTAYGDPTADATCALSELTNTNFGTVSTYTVTNAMPGIVFTPKKVGKYYICAVTQAAGAANSAVIGLRLTDGTNVIASQLNKLPASASSDLYSFTLCGIYNATSISSATLRIEGKASSSSVTISGNATDHAIVWSIFAIDQQLPAPLLVNSVVSKYSGVMGTEHAEINCDASSSLTSNPGSWLSSIGNRSTASCALTIASGVFSATPYSCQVTVKAATVQATSCSCSSATACTVYGASADYDAYVSITGPR